MLNDFYYFLWKYVIVIITYIINNYDPFVVIISDDLEVIKEYSDLIIKYVFN